MGGAYWGDAQRRTHDHLLVTALLLLQEMLPWRLPPRRVNAVIAAYICSLCESRVVTVVCGLSSGVML